MSTDDKQKVTSQGSAPFFIGFIKACSDFLKLASWHAGGALSCRNLGEEAIKGVLAFTGSEATADTNFAKIKKIKREDMIMRIISL